MKFLNKTLIILFLAILPFKAQEQSLTETQQVSGEIGQQVLCMAKNIQYEAAHESFEGKLAVAQVTMNRANSSAFPSTVCEVVYQKVNNTYQFSWVGERPKSNTDKYAWEESMIVARKALTETKLHDTIYKTKSMYYHNTSVNPAWKLKRVTQIGNHIFYTKA